MDNKTGHIATALRDGQHAFKRGEHFKSNPFDHIADETKANLWDAGWVRAEAAKVREDVCAQRQRLHSALRRIL
jgi:hypothetical protein